MREDSKDKSSPNGDSGIGPDDDPEGAERRSENQGKAGEPELGSSSAEDRSVGEELRTLEAILERTGRKIRQPVFGEGALWYTATVCAVLLSGLVVAALAGDLGYAIARWIIAVGVVSSTVGALVAGGLYYWRRAGAEQIAARIQRHSTEFRSDLVAALEFGRALCQDEGESLKNHGLSPAMARAHLSQTVRRVRDASEDNSLAHLLPRRDLTPPILACSGGVALLLIPLVLQPGWTLGVITAERAGAPIVGERVVEEMIVGSMDGIFVYPGYTGLDRRLQELGSGYIESLEGTEIHLRAHLMPRDWESIQMVVETGEEPQLIEMKVEEDRRRASAQIVVEESGHYWFKARTTDGRPIEDRRKRRIRVIGDEAPRVRVTSHEGRVEVQPDDVVEFDIEVIDDFGIDSLRRAVHFQGSPDDRDYKRIDPTSLAAQPTSFETRSTLDLGPLDLQPKDGVVVYFEARDNNTATGPGIGESKRILLYVESPEDKHMRNLARQQEVMEALLSHLADFLENPVGDRLRQDDGTYRQRVDAGIDDVEKMECYEQTRHLHERREAILESMVDLVEILEEDPLVVPRNLTLFKGLLSQLERLHGDGETMFSRLAPRAERRDLTALHLQEVADYAARTEEDLERGILSLEDLLVSQKMDLVEATAQEIEQLRDRLRSLLEEYRDTEDPELKAAIEREIQRLRQRMQELMRRMQMQIREMPREHVNLEAMENLEMESRAADLGSDLDNIEQMLQDGDIDGALEALDQMELDLDSLTGEMSDSFAQMQPAGLSELDQAVGEMMDEVNQLQEMEEALEERTRQLQEELREQRREQLEEMLEPFVDELLEEVEAQRRDLEEIDGRRISQQDRSRLHRAEQQVESLREMLEQQDLEQALERARQSTRALRGLRSTMSLSQRYADERSQQARDLERSLRDADQMIERGASIEDRIEEFMEQAQQDLEPQEEQRFDELADEQSQIRERAEQLQDQIGEQSDEYPVLQEELSPSMQGAQEAMEGAEQRLRERRMQPALDAERQAIEQLGQLGESMQNALQRQRREEREQGQRTGSDEEVEIPGEDDRQMRERLREEMMEGMREGRMEEYESQIERYFRSLVE